VSGRSSCMYFDEGTTEGFQLLLLNCDSESFYKRSPARYVLR